MLHSFHWVTRIDMSLLGVGKRWWTITTLWRRGSLGYMLGAGGLVSNGRLSDGVVKLRAKHVNLGRGHEFLEIPCREATHDLLACEAFSLSIQLLGILPPVESMRVPVSLPQGCRRCGAMPTSRHAGVMGHVRSWEPLKPRDPPCFFLGIVANSCWVPFSKSLTWILRVGSLALGKPLDY